MSDIRKELSLDELDRVAGGDQKEYKWVDYKVIEDDSLDRIAFIYGCTKKDIKRWNNLSSNKVTAGTILKIWTINY